jgi:hypothetical protein
LVPKGLAVFTARSVTPRDAGTHFAELMSGYSSIHRIWVASDINGIDIHVLTAATDAQSEREIYKIGSELRKRYPTAIINIRLVNPNLWDIESETDLIAQAVPPGSTEISLVSDEPED